MFAVLEATQVVGTLAAVYGVLVYPIGWTYALLIWAYALAWLPINSAVAIAVRRLFDMEWGFHKHHLTGVERHVSGAGA